MGAPSLEKWETQGWEPRRVGGPEPRKVGRPTKVDKSPEGWSQGGSGQKGEAQKGGSQQIPVFLFLVTSNSTPFHHSDGSVHGMLVVFFLLFQLGASKTRFGASWSSGETPGGPRGPDWRRNGPGEDGPLGGRSRRGRSRGGRSRGRERSVCERLLQGEGFQRVMKQQKSSSEEEEEEEEDSKNTKREKREKKRKKQEKKHQKKKKKNSRKAEEEDGN